MSIKKMFADSLAFLRGAGEGAVTTNRCIATIVFIIGLVLCANTPLLRASHTSPAVLRSFRVDLNAHPNRGQHIAVNPAAGRVYVGGYSPRSSEGALQVIDLGTGATLSEIRLPYVVTGLAVNPLTNRIYAASHNPTPDFPCCSTLVVLDGETHAVLANVPVGGYPDSVAVNPATGRVYVANILDVKVIDGSTHEIVATIPAPSNLASVALDQAVNQLYVGAGRSRVNVFDLTTHAFVTSVFLADDSSNVARLVVNPRTHRVYAGHGKRVAIIDGTTNVLRTTVELPMGGGGLAVDPSTERVYVSYNEYFDGWRGQLAVIDGTTDILLPPVSSPHVLRGPLTVNPAADRVYALSHKGVGCMIEFGDGDAAAFDVAVPEIAEPVFSVNPKSVDESSTLMAVVVDDRGTIAEAEYWMNGPGLPQDRWYEPMEIVGSDVSATIGARLSAGLYEVVVRARDNEPCNFAYAQSEPLVVYDPEGPSVTGAGRIIPSGPTSESFPPDNLPGMDGTAAAQISFNVRYQADNSTVPSGALQLNFTAGDFRATVTRFHWLVSTLGMVYVRGTARIGSIPDEHELLMSVIDGDLLDPPTADRVDIRLYAPGAEPLRVYNEPRYKASGAVQGQIAVRSR